MVVFPSLLVEEILHQLIGSLSRYLHGFIHLRWCRISSINSSISFPIKTQPIDFVFSGDDFAGFD